MHMLLKTDLSSGSKHLTNDLAITASTEFAEQHVQKILIGRGIKVSNVSRNSLKKNRRIYNYPHNANYRFWMLKMPSHPKVVKLDTHGASRYVKRVPLGQ